MSTLFNQYQPIQQFDEPGASPGEKSTAGERFATALLLFYTSTALIISGWSALVMLSGNIENGGPIGMFIRMLQTSGIV